MDFKAIEGKVAFESCFPGAWEVELADAPEICCHDTFASNQRSVQEKKVMFSNVLFFVCAFAAIASHLAAATVKGKLVSKKDTHRPSCQAYRQFPGMFPTIAGMIATHGPYKQVAAAWRS